VPKTQSRASPGNGAANRQIAVTCRTADSLPLDKIVAFQGELKSLSKAEFEKLKKSIVKFGLSFPSFIWKQNDSAKCLDGHQRSRVLTEMRKEGWTIPPVPVVYVDAKNEKEAKEKILLLSSQYGKMSMDSLYEFMSGSDLGLDSLDTVELPEFDVLQFEDYYFNDNFQPQAVRGQQRFSLPIGELKPHPLNYREHPDDQVDHLIESIKKSGFTRNVVVAMDNTILAGHGVVKAAAKMGMRYVPVMRLGIDKNDPLALKILVGDNEVSKAADVDDRSLADTLKGIIDSGNELLGTGFDKMKLAALAFVTRTEINNQDIAAHWVGMPDYETGSESFTLIVSFRNEDDRAEFVRKIDIGRTTQFSNGRRWSCWWPPKEKDDDINSVRFE